VTSTEYRAALTRVRDSIVAQLEEMTANPKPDYSIPGGPSVSWGAHFNNLMKALEELEQRLARGEHPWWRLSKARP